MTENGLPAQESGVPDASKSSSVADNTSGVSTPKASNLYKIIGAIIAILIVGGATSIILNHPAQTVATNSTSSLIISIAPQEKFSDYIFCVGNDSLPAGSLAFSWSNRSYYTQILADGSLGNWQSTSRYPVNISFPLSCLIYNDTVFCLGGGSGKAYFASISSSGIGTWKQTTNSPFNYSSGSCSVLKDKIYCLGGQNENYTKGVGNVTYPSNQVFFAPLSSTTGIGQWTKTTSIPLNMSYGTLRFYDASFPRCSIYSNTIFCIAKALLGTTYEVTTNATFFAPILPDGTVGQWKTTTPYPSQLWFSFLESAGGCSLYNGDIFCVGDDLTSATSYSNVSYFAPVSSSGIGTWSASSAPMPSQLSGASCVLHGSQIYCINTNNIFYATLSSEGIAGWKNTTPSPVKHILTYCVSPGVNSGTQWSSSQIQ